MVGHSLLERLGWRTRLQVPDLCLFLYLISRPQISCLLQRPPVAFCPPPGLQLQASPGGGGLPAPHPHPIPPGPAPLPSPIGGPSKSNCPAQALNSRRQVTSTTPGGVGRAKLINGRAVDEGAQPRAIHHCRLPRPVSLQMEKEMM